MKKSAWLLFVLLTVQSINAALPELQCVETYTLDSLQMVANRFEYVRRGDAALMLDVYHPQGAPKLNKTVMYVFGGGFIRGSKSHADNVSFYKSLLDAGYTVIAIDYRLGLKGVDKVGVTHSKPIFKAVEMAAEDLVAATDFVIDHNHMLGVDTDQIALIGSSAGGITVLRAEYELANRAAMVDSLPEDFRYSAVVSMAGALLTNHGRVRYDRSPAPTLLFHGTDDKVVFYKGPSLGKLSMMGTKRLSHKYRKEGYAYDAYHFEGAKHEVAEFPRHYLLGAMLRFLDRALAGDPISKRQLDVMMDDTYSREHFMIDLSLDDLYD